LIAFQHHLPYKIHMLSGQCGASVYHLRCLSHTPSDTLKLLIGQAYLNLRAICFNNEIFLDECIAIAYEKIKEEKEDDGI